VICLNYDFLDCFVPRNDVKRENKTVNRHCGFNPQSPAKRYIVIASREVRAAWQSRRILSNLACLFYRRQRYARLRLWKFCPSGIKKPYFYLILFTKQPQ